MQAEEQAIRNVIIALQKIESDERITDAIILLSQALNIVIDCVEDKIASEKYLNA